MELIVTLDLIVTHEFIKITGLPIFAHVRFGEDTNVEPIYNLLITYPAIIYQFSLIIDLKIESSDMKRKCTS